MEELEELDYSFENENELPEKPEKVLYCHFSFRRPKGKKYGIFAAALYADDLGKMLIDRKVRALELWEDQQYITAIQSYSYALQCIWEWDTQLIKYNVSSVLLVSDNGILVDWIENSEKMNKVYAPYMEKAVHNYRIGASKGITTHVGLYETQRAEKSHKYCQEKFLDNKIPLTEEERESIQTTKINITNTPYQTIDEILNKKENQVFETINNIESNADKTFNIADIL